MEIITIDYRTNKLHYESECWHCNWRWFTWYTIQTWRWLCGCIFWEITRECAYDYYKSTWKDYKKHKEEVLITAFILHKHFRF